MLLACGLLVTAVALSGDNPAVDPIHRLFAVRSDATLVTLVPQYWRGGRVTAPAHTTRETFVDPAHPSYSLSIDVQRHAPASAVRRAKLAVAQIALRAGAAVARDARARFPGGRTARLVEYQQSGVPHAMYIFSACAPATVAVSVDVSAPTRAELSGPLAQLAAATGPRC